MVYREGGDPIAPRPAGRSTEIKTGDQAEYYRLSLGNQSGSVYLAVEENRELTVIAYVPRSLLPSSRLEYISKKEMDEVLEKARKNLSIPAGD